MAGLTVQDTPEFLEYFWSRVEKTEGCWLWTGLILNTGYGQLRIRGRRAYAHRVSYALRNGPIPQGPGYHGWVVCHQCDNRRCVNPDHLFLGTMADNTRDRDQKNRTAKGSRSRRAVLTEDVVTLIRSLHLDGFRKAEVSRLLGVGVSAVAHVLKGRCWAHLSYPLTG